MIDRWGDKTDKRIKGREKEKWVSGFIYLFVGFYASSPPHGRLSPFDLDLDLDLECIADINWAAAI